MASHWLLRQPTGLFSQFVPLRRSPGFGITLVAETTNGAFLTAETCSNPKGSTEPPSVPEDIGKEAATLLLEEIYRVCHKVGMLGWSEVCMCSSHNGKFKKPSAGYVVAGISGWSEVCRVYGS